MRSILPSPRTFQSLPPLRSCQALLPGLTQRLAGTSSSFPHGIYRKGVDGVVYAVNDCESFTPRCDARREGQLLSIPMPTEGSTYYFYLDQDSPGKLFLPYILARGTLKNRIKNFLLLISAIDIMRYSHIYFCRIIHLFFF